MHHYLSYESPNEKQQLRAMNANILMIMMIMMIYNACFPPAHPNKETSKNTQKSWYYHLKFSGSIIWRYSNKQTNKKKQLAFSALPCFYVNRGRVDKDKPHLNYNDGQKQKYYAQNKKGKGASTTIFPSLSEDKYTPGPCSHRRNRTGEKTLWSPSRHFFNPNKWKSI